jgi:hypothetical protein
LKATQAANGIKDKISSPGLEKPIKPAKPKSFLGKLASGAKSLVKNHPLVKLFRKKEETPDSKSAKPAESQGFLSKIKSGVKGMFNKTKDSGGKFKEGIKKAEPGVKAKAALEKTKQLGATAVQGGKTLLGKTKQKITEASNTETGQKAKAVGTKALDKGKYFASQAASMGMSLAGKAKQKAAEKIPGMLTSGKAAAAKAAGSVAATARSLPGVMKSKSQALKQTIDTKAKEPNSLLGGAAKFAKAAGEKTVSISKKVGAKAAAGGKNLADKAKQSKDRVVSATTGESSDGDTPKNRLSDMMGTAKDKSKGFIKNAIPMSQKMGSKALAGAAIMGQRSKQFIEKLGENEIEKEKQEKEQAAGGGTSIISNSSSSSNSTTINRFDTDVVSKWRSQYVDDQHRPGHYSMYS